MTGKGQGFPTSIAHNAISIQLIFRLKGGYRLLSFLDNNFLCSNLFGQFSYLFYFCPSPINTLKI
jgi:hypothetical protein